MDPVDREQPWGVAGKLLVITCAIAVIYLMIRFAAVVPEWGWQLVLPITATGAVVYYLLAFPRARARDREGDRTRRRAALETLATWLLAFALSMPAALAAWMLWQGALPWD